MSYKKLYDFINNKMRMSHIYQPLMLKTLLNNKGKASSNRIAKALLSRDVSQIEYYEQITKTMVGKVLTTNRKITEKENDDYLLIGYSDLKKDERKKLVDLCEKKITNFLNSRGDKAWDHRKKSSGYISGTLRYEVLKRAKFRCELCGVSADKKALEVDHIIPRNKNGTDDKSNLQSLCYSCNAMKRDRDDEDLRMVSESYNKRDSECLFCNIPKKRIILENELAYAIYDKYPVTKLHTLVIPKRHFSEYFDIYQPERNAVNEILEEQKNLILEKDKTVTGFNIGINSGEDAGQTIMHCHFHLIPRRKGDVKNPRGGVRGVIANKQNY